MIPIYEPLLCEDDKKNVQICLDTNWISSQGKFVTEFESLLSNLHGGFPCAVTSSCTTALHLALVALEVGPDDEVICPDLTFIAPANMILLAGATPVLVDVEERSLCIDPEQLEKKISPRTKAIIVVHAFGHAANMLAIMKIAKKHNILVIEDVAESPGASMNGQLLGTFGDVACFSFFGNKIFTTGEGGACLSKQADLIEKIKMLRDHGMSKERRYYHPIVGYNYRMTNMQAALGCGQLSRFQEILQHRSRIEGWYRSRLSGYATLTCRQHEKWSQSVFWLATITLSEKSGRDDLASHLQSCNIESRPMVFPVHQAPPFSQFWTNDLVNSASISSRSLHLPSSSTLDERIVESICDAIHDWHRGGG